MSMRVGVLTAGGDAPGLNAAICGLGRRLLEHGVELVGFADGWRGLIENVTRTIDPASFQHMLVDGGTSLGSRPLSHPSDLSSLSHDRHRSAAEPLSAGGA